MSYDNLTNTIINPQVLNLGGKSTCQAQLAIKPVNNLCAYSARWEEKRLLGGHFFIITPMMVVARTGHHGDVGRARKTQAGGVGWGVCVCVCVRGGVLMRLAGLSITPTTTTPPLPPPGQALRWSIQQCWGPGSRGERAIKELPEMESLFMGCRGDATPELTKQVSAL